MNALDTQLASVVSRMGLAAFESAGEANQRIHEAVD